MAPAIIRIERLLVVFFAKSGGVIETFMIAEPIAKVAIQSNQMEKVIALEDALMLDHQVVLL